MKYQVLMIGLSLFFKQIGKPDETSNALHWFYTGGLHATPALPASQARSTTQSIDG